MGLRTPQNITLAIGVLEKLRSETQDSELQICDTRYRSRRVDKFVVFDNKKQIVK